MRFTFFQDLYQKSTEITKELDWPDVVKMLTTHKRTPEKYGYGFSPVTYTPGPCDCGTETCLGMRGHAVSRNVLGIHALMLDLDKSEGGGDLGHAEALRHIAHLKSLDIQAIVHSTHSYAPPLKSKWHVFIPLSRSITRAEFKPFWKAAIDWLGLPSGIKTDNPARFWHLPSCPEDGAKPQSIVFTGTPLDVESVLKDIVIEESAEPTANADHTFAAASPGLINRVRDALKDHGPAVSGDGGKVHAYEAACIVVNDYALNDIEVHHVLKEWDAMNSPPRGDYLTGKCVRDANRYATGPYGEERETYEFLESVGGASPFSEAVPPKGSFRESVLEAAADWRESLGKSDEKSELLPFFISAQDLISQDFPSTPWIVKGVLTKYALAAVATDPKAGKTWAATEMVIAIASGTKAFGEFEVEQGRCAYFYAEDQGAAVQNRIKSLCVSRGNKIPAELHLQPRGRDLDINSDLSMAIMIASCRAIGDLKLLVLDPLRDLHASAEDSSDEMSQVMKRLRTLGKILNCAVMFVHHASKGSADTAARRPGQRMRGSGAIHGALDCGLYMSNTGTESEEGHISNRVDVEIKGAKGVGSMNLLLKIVDDVITDTAIEATWEVSFGAPKSDDDEHMTEVVKAVGASEARLEDAPTEKEIHKSIGGTRVQAKNSIASALKAGYLSRQYIGDVARGWCLTTQGKGLFAQIVGAK